MNLTDIRNDVLRKVGVEDPANAPAFILADVLNAVNAAGRLLNLAGEPFWESTDGSFTAGSASTSGLFAGHTVKSVANADLKPLMRCESRFSLLYSHSVYFGFTDEQAADASFEAMCYYAESERQDNGVDQTRIVVGPQQLADGQNIIVFYIPNYVPFVVADLADVTKKVSVPFGMVETVYLPIVRYLITRCHWFSRGDLAAGIERDFQSAIGMVRAANPAVASVWMDQRQESPTKGGGE